MTNNRHRYILQWLLCSILIVLFSACSSSSVEEGVTHQQAKLAIYVYAPEQAAAKKNAPPTRGDVGEVDAITNEGTIKSLHIWIYEQETGNYVGYFSTEDVSALNQGQGTIYQIPVSDDFASKKPYVNVYVMANVTSANCGIETLNKETTRAALLEGAKITAVCRYIDWTTRCGRCPNAACRYTQCGIYRSTDACGVEVALRLCQDYRTANSEYHQHQNEYWHDTRRGVSLPDTAVHDL